MGFYLRTSSVRSGCVVSISSPTQTIPTLSTSLMNCQDPAQSTRDWGSTVQRRWLPSLTLSQSLTCDTVATPSHINCIWVGIYVWLSHWLQSYGYTCIKRDSLLVYSTSVLVYSTSVSGACANVHIGCSLLTECIDVLVPTVYINTSCNIIMVKL